MQNQDQIKKKIYNFFKRSYAYFIFYLGRERRSSIEQLGKRLEEIRLVDPEKIQTNGQLKVLLIRIADFVKFVKENNSVTVAIDIQERKFQKSTEYTELCELRQRVKAFIKNSFPKIKLAVRKQNVSIAEPLSTFSVAGTMSEEQIFSLYYQSLDSKFEANDLDMELSINTQDLLKDIRYLTSSILQKKTDRILDQVNIDAKALSDELKELISRTNRHYDYYRLTDLSKLERIANAINDPDAYADSLLLQLNYKDVLREDLSTNELDPYVARMLKRDYPDQINSSIRTYNFISEHLIQESPIVLIARFFWETAGKLVVGYIFLRILIYLLNLIGVPIPLTTFFSVS